MAVIQIRASTNGNVLAEETIPDTAFPSIRKAFGGTTNQQTAAAVLDTAIEAVRKRALEAELHEQQAIDMATLNANQTVEREDFATDVWPE